ncbi:MAG: WxL domain-containing protein [Anaerolineaceae bacterium]|nr:WxL domain-containing protein [Anaerolineaceae bacterium]
MKNIFGSKKTWKWRWMSGMGIALLLLLAVATTSFADDVVGSMTVTGGSLTIDAVDNPAFPGVTLNGTSQSVSDSIAIDVQDLRGSGAGWQLEVTSTTFTNGTQTLPTTALSITDVISACDGTTCTDPTNGYLYPLTVPADATAPSAVAFFDAALNTGLGDFTITPTFSLAVPATTYAGTYNSTITLTVANVP